MRHRILVPFLSVLVLTLSVRPAAAQFIGTFSWQQSPHCNVITLNVTQVGSAFALDGYDSQCGGERRAPVTGVAILNPNGTVGLGLTIVDTLGAEPIHLWVEINLATLSGSWVDGFFQTGDFVFNGAGGGSPRITGIVTATRFGTFPSFIGTRINGTADAPAAVAESNVLVNLGGSGHDGAAFPFASDGQIRVVASENWTPSSHGTRIELQTTPNGSTLTSTRMAVDHDGDVGIGTLSPTQRLDVTGNVRIGIGALGCVEDRDGDVIAGVCASDARFKRDVVSFEPMLNKVAALRPVDFYWRSDEFPARSFGSQQSYGLMAQEVEAVLPELVVTDADGYKAVNYSKLPLIAIQAIKDLKDENDTIKAENGELARRLARIEAYLRLP